MLISKCRHNLSADNQAKNEKALLHRIELALLWCLDAFESSLLNGLECMKRNWEISICVCTFLDSRCVTKSLLENMEFLLRDQNLCKNFFFWLFLILKDICMQGHNTMGAKGHFRDLIKPPHSPLSHDIALSPLTFQMTALPLCVCISQ